jgi:hypothetical protein
VAAELVFSSKKVLAMDFRHCQILDPVGDAVAFPKSECTRDQQSMVTGERCPGDCCSGSEW